MRTLLLPIIALLFLPQIAEAQEAKRRWEMMNQIRRDKFDYVLPEVMRENDIDMWITMNREGHNDPLYEDLGGGCGGNDGLTFSQRELLPCARAPGFPPVFAL